LCQSTKFAAKATNPSFYVNRFYMAKSLHFLATKQIQNRNKSRWR